MAIDPCLRSISPQRAELPEEPAISVEFRLLQTSHSLLWFSNAPARAAQFFGRILLGMTRRPLVRCVKPQPPIRRRRQGRHHPVLALSYVYYKSEPGRRAAADLLTRDTIVCAKCRSSGPFDRALTRACPLLSRIMKHAPLSSTSQGGEKRRSGMALG